MSKEKKKIKFSICKGDLGLMKEDIKKYINKKKEDKEENSL